MTLNYLTRSQVHHALCLKLEEVEACRDLAGVCHTAGQEDLAAKYLLQADDARQALEVLTEWLLAFLWAQGKTAVMPTQSKITAKQFQTAMASLPAHLKEQGS